MIVHLSTKLKVVKLLICKYKTMNTKVLSMILGFQNNIENTHNQIINDILVKFDNAKNLPRKKKKKVRKLCNKDYNFYMNLKTYFDENFMF